MSNGAVNSRDMNWRERSSLFQLTVVRFKLFLRENDETPSLLWALVGGLTWIRK